MIYLFVNLDEAGDFIYNVEEVELGAQQVHTSEMLADASATILLSLTALLFSL